MKKYLPVALLFLVGVFAQNTPIVSTSPPSGQYHTLSQLWIKKGEPVNWQWVTFENLIIQSVKLIDAVLVNPTVNGNIIVNGNVYANAFIDKNNNNYYVKPSGTSKLNILYTNSLYVSGKNIISLINDINSKISQINNKISYILSKIEQLQTSINNMRTYIKPNGVIYTYKICLNTACTAYIYYDKSSNILYIKAPSVQIITS